jgi:hypothetical protein
VKSEVTGWIPLNSHLHISLSTRICTHIIYLLLSLSHFGSYLYEISLLFPILKCCPRISLLFPIIKLFLSIGAYLSSYKLISSSIVTEINFKCTQFFIQLFPIFHFFIYILLRLEAIFLENIMLTYCVIWNWSPPLLKINYNQTFTLTTSWNRLLWSLVTKGPNANPIW